MNAFFIVLFGLLQIADGVVTFLGLSFAPVDEANPVLNYATSLVGLGESIVLLKAAGLAFIIFLFCDRHKMKSQWITAGLGSSVGFYTYVVSSNVLLVVGV